MLGKTADNMRPEFYHVDQNTLVIPVGKLATVSTAKETVETDRRQFARDGKRPSDSFYRQSCNVSVMSGSYGSDCDTDSLASSFAHVDTDAVQVICRYDSQPSLLPSVRPQPAVSCLQFPPADTHSVNITDFSSIVEIDGDCVIIHSRLEDAATGPAADHPTDTPITERCRRFYQSRLRARRPPDTASDDDTDVDTDGGPTSVDSGRESGSDSVVGVAGSTPLQSFGSPTNSLELKMSLLRREMASLMHQDDDLFRQLLALNDSIEALKYGAEGDDPGSLSPASSLSSLAEMAADSCSPTSTLSSGRSRQSHLSSDSGTFALVKSKYRSQPTLFADHFPSTDYHRPGSRRSFCEATPASLQLRVPAAHRSQLQVPLASPHQLQRSLPSLQQHGRKLSPPAGHKKQLSCDSGIVERQTQHSVVDHW